MDGFVGGSESFLRPSPSQLYLYPHPRPRPQEVDRPGKRRRSSSPLNEKIPSRCKRTTLLHYPSEPAPMKNTWENDLIPNQTHKPITTISAAVESINECATRLGLENNRFQDIEMDSRSESDREEDNDLEPNYERVTVQPVALSSNSTTLLPLHKPHPIAYQQHLALISSNRSNKALKCINHLNHPKKKPLEDIKVKKLNRGPSS